jgi:hypothetical protein
MSTSERTVLVVLLTLALAVVAVRVQSKATDTTGPTAYMAASNDQEPERVGTMTLPRKRYAPGPDVTIEVEPVDPAEQAPELNLPEEELQTVQSDEEMVTTEDLQGLIASVIDQIDTLDDPQVTIPMDDASVGPWSMTDQEVMDELMQVLDPEQRVIFNEMWQQLTAAERREWLSQMRVSLAG